METMKTMIGYMIALLFPLLYFLNVGLSQKWHDKRTQKHKIVLRIIFGVITIIAIINILNFYFITRSNKELRDIVAKEEKQNKILTAVERMNCIISSDKEYLDKKYPEGYYLFMTNDQTTIPANPKIIEKIELDHQNCKITENNNKFVHISLKNFRYKIYNNTIKNLEIILEKKIGATAEGIFFGDIGFYVELLSMKNDEFVYVIGLKKFEKRELIKLNPNMMEYIQTIKKRLPPPLNFNNHKYIILENWVIVSGWEYIS